MEQMPPVLGSAAVLVFNVSDRMSGIINVDLCRYDVPPVDGEQTRQEVQDHCMYGRDSIEGLWM